MTGLYRALSELAPGASLPPIPDPDGEWLLDLADLDHEESLHEEIAAMRSRNNINEALYAIYKARK